MKKYPTIHSQKMENEMTFMEENSGNFSCDECGTKFQKPILATLSGNGNVQTYYACPHCLTKVGEAKTPEKEESVRVSTKVYRKPEGIPEIGTKCQHYLGYLKKRPKNTPIPDECLTCDKMIECLIH